VPGDLLLAGRVGKPHGLSGEVYVDRISDDPRRFEPGSQLIHEDGRVLTIAAVRPHGDRFLVRFEDVDDRNAAERLRGALYVPAAERRALDEDEYWPDDLIGMEVVDVSGARLGTVTDVRGTGAQDLLVVDGRSFVPMVKEIVRDVDVEARVIAIDPPEGLIGS
jgi:16S rRNA processing protein RimM